jgi:hypothetical protein
MKSKFLWLTLAIVAALAVVWFATRPPPPKPPPFKPVVSIQDHATIDFSSGQPVVRRSAEEKAIIDAAVKEMDEAARNIKLTPIVPPKVEVPVAAKK